MKIAFDGAIWVQGSKTAFPPGSLRYDATVDLISIWLKQEDLAVIYVLWSDIQNASGATFGSKAQATDYLNAVFTATSQNEVANAGQSISALRAVKFTGSGLFYIDSENLGDANLCVGITTTSATTGSPVSYLMRGFLDDASFSWVIGSSVFVGSNGALTQTPPQSPSVFSLRIGSAVTSTKIKIQIEQPIIL